MAESYESGLDKQVDLASMRFEALVEMLESLIKQMSDSEVGIERATDLYEQADLIHKAASQRLEEVAERLSKLQEDSGASNGTG